MNEIQMIPVGKLFHHPENPRMELGDLTELADSIRKCGIMQNLTVVPGHQMTKEEWIREAMAEGADRTSAEASWRPADAWCGEGYTVVIGNRRMEAAKQAGVAEVPCAVCDMSYQEQIATMLQENMQREDLTVYEQAQGFQMMMDLGFSREEISERTGFSDSTVRRRLKMAEMDRKAFQKAVGAQIRMDDLDRLIQLDSVKERNALLKEYGENNFEWKLNRALKAQKANRVRSRAHQRLQEAKARKIPDSERYKIYNGDYEEMHSWRLELDKWDGKQAFVPDVPELYFKEDEFSIEFYTKKKKKKAEPVPKSAEELAQERDAALAWKTAERFAETSWELRKAFAEKIGVNPRNAMEIAQWAIIAGMVGAFGYDTPTETIRKDEKIPVSGYNTGENQTEVFKWIYGLPQSKWASVILMMFEGDKKSNGGWATGTRREKPKKGENRKLDICYQFLRAFGYKMSDEEERMQDGTHECYQEVQRDEQAQES